MFNSALRSPVSAVVVAVAFAEPLAAQSGIPKQEAKLVAADAGPSKRFGYRVAIEGGTVLVADSQGSVYRFDRTAGLWTAQGKLVPAEATSSAYGSALAISGDTAVVGDLDSTGPTTGPGSAYVFVRDGIVWTEEARLIASDSHVGASFGESVAISGNTVVVGDSKSG